MQKLMLRQNFLDIQKFIQYLNSDGQLSHKSINRYNSYLRHLLYWAMDRPLSKPDQIKPGFVQYLKDYKSPETHKQLSRESWRKILGVASQFFEWASFNLSRYPTKFRSFGRNLKIPTNIRDERSREYITLEELLIIARLEIDPTDLALRRDQAMACLLYLTGMRASASVTVPIYAVDPQSRKVIQNPRDGVITKHSKFITSGIFPIPEIFDVVVSWHEFVTAVLPISYPWYPVIDQNWGQQEFSIKDPGGYRNQTLNKRLRILAKYAGISYHSSHNFRRGHVVLVAFFSEGMGEFKLLSQHLGHSNIMITDEYYNQLKKQDLEKRMRKFMEKFEFVTDANYQPD